MMMSTSLPFSFLLARSGLDKARPKVLQPSIRNLPPVLLECGRRLGVRWYAADLSDQGSTTTFKVGTGTRQIPKYNEFAKAIDVFDNPCFHWSDILRDAGCQVRQEVLGNLTVKEVYLKFTLECEDGAKSGLQSLANAILVKEVPVWDYYDGINLKAEDILNFMKVVPLDKSKDVDLFKKKIVLSLPTSQLVLKNAASEIGDKRALHNLALVLGSSGSGKTFFALNDLPLFRADVKKYKKTVTWHVYPSHTGVPFFTSNNQVNPDAAADLCQWMTKQASELCQREINYKLPMHVCIVLDEAGDLNVRSWFENMDMLRSLCHQAETIAESVLVVVCGTALTGRELNSQNDAYVFRMRPWNKDDLATILSKDRTLMSTLKENETPEEVANAIFGHPKLGALATNARSAYFLYEAITDLSCRYRRTAWKLQLNTWATTLMTKVVEGYIGSNALSDLDLDSQRRVAASVFRALQNSKKGKVTLPTFVALDDKEMAVASALMETNIECGEDKQVKLVSNQHFATTVTPAIAVVLYALAGIPTTLLPGWKAEKELAGLYAVRQLILRSMETYENDVFCEEGRFNESCRLPNLARETLDHSLEDIQLLVLQTRVMPLPAKSGEILVPMVGASTVLVNGEQAPFAEVIAPYMLIRAAKQRTSESNKPVNLHEELDKCTLLRSSDDDRLLRGLVELWRGNLDSNVDRTEDANLQRNSARFLQTSAAFPENMLCLETPVDPCAFAVIQGTSITVGDKKRPLPPLDGTTKISFVLSTNADEIRLVLSPPGIVVRITERNLDNDLRINSDTFLMDAERTAWTNFVRDHVRNGVEIKILLTKSL